MDGLIQQRKELVDALVEKQAERDKLKEALEQITKRLTAEIGELDKEISPLDEQISALQLEIEYQETEQEDSFEGYLDIRYQDIVLLSLTRLRFLVVKMYRMRGLIFKRPYIIEYDGSDRTPVKASIYDYYTFFYVHKCLLCDKLLHKTQECPELEKYRYMESFVLGKKEGPSLYELSKSQLIYLLVKHDKLKHPKDILYRTWSGDGCSYCKKRDPECLKYEYIRLLKQCFH